MTILVGVLSLPCLRGIIGTRHLGGRQLNTPSQLLQRTVKALQVMTFSIGLIYNVIQINLLAFEFHYPGLTFNMFGEYLLKARRQARMLFIIYNDVTFMLICCMAKSAFWVAIILGESV